MTIRFTKKKIIIGIILIGVIIMGIFGVKSLTSTREINEEKSFSLENIKEIQVSMLNEAVHVIKTKVGGEVKFHLYGKITKETKLISECDNEKIVVKENRSKCGSFEELFLDIYIPEDYNKSLSIKVSSGDMKMDSLNLSDFSLSSTSGKIDIEKITTDKLDLMSTSGNISINDCTAKEAKIETSSGKAMISYKQFENENVNIKTSSGNIIVEFPSNAEFLLKAQTNAGNIQDDFSSDMVGSTERRKIEGQIGTKSNVVTLKSSSGSISILKK
ncbi:MAG: DUF4097 family beta strand repeat-containing protein [Oscillospiraceae bacterium]